MNKKAMFIVVALIILTMMIIGVTPQPGEQNSVSKYSNAIIGTWQTENDPWGLFTYTFYNDGYCKGEYLGHVGGVQPSLYPNSYYEGFGDGCWTFIENEPYPLLRIDYNGDQYGDGCSSMYYEFDFSDNYNELIIYGIDTYWGQARGSAVWRKVNE